jgi:hypothetical protein
MASQDRPLGWIVLAGTALLLASCLEDEDQLARIDALEADNAALQTEVDELTTRLDELMAYVEVDAESHAVKVVGANLYVQNGLETTDGDPNGLGNLIVGYDEEDSDDPIGKTGSHNLVVGVGHNYTSYGGAVFGLENSIQGPYSNVLGGSLNLSEGTSSVVISGILNSASGDMSAVVAGSHNTASGEYSATLAGTVASASARYSAVVGGVSGQANAMTSVMVGGYGNIAEHEDSVVLGGDTQTSTGEREISPWPE